jgi:hypothetical protein
VRRALSLRLLGRRSQRKWGGSATTQLGAFSDIQVTAPIAAYRQVNKLYGTAGSVLIQHGSYQWISHQDQPHMEQGQALLYRGIAETKVFRCLQFRPEELSAVNHDIWRKYLGVQAAMLSDSVLSFNTVHDRVNRCETGGLRHATWLGDAMATAGWTRHQIHRLCQSALVRSPAVVYPGPNHGDAEIRSPLCCAENPAEQPPDHDILRRRVRGEGSRSEPGLRGGYRWVPGGIHPSIECATARGFRGLMLTKPSAELTLFDTLSRLTFVRATKLLGAEGNQLIAAGGKYDIDITTPGQIRSGSVSPRR